MFYLSCRTDSTGGSASDIPASLDFSTSRRSRSERHHDRPRYRDCTISSLSAGQGHIRCSRKKLVVLRRSKGFDRFPLSGRTQGFSGTR
ncbi:MAG TPA: hypothetical protein DHV39_03355, partial [Verrucomicrobiales bacterium]|nr:hypothetical protein [Verrucomicrobiales bacterium]